MVGKLFRSRDVLCFCVYELTGIPVKKPTTLMVTPNGEVKVFDKRNKGTILNY